MELPKFEEANEIHETRSKPWSTPHAHKYEHVRCVRSDVIYSDLFRVFRVLVLHSVPFRSVK